MYLCISPGALSEDPNFPKVQWPSPEMCPACHTVMENGDHGWNQEQGVLPFLLSYFSSDSILTGRSLWHIFSFLKSSYLINSRILSNCKKMFFLIPLCVYIYIYFLFRFRPICDYNILRSYEQDKMYMRIMSKASHFNIEVMTSIMICMCLLAFPCQTILKMKARS